MESLESKLDRLSQEQRKEVEVFVDFLLYRSGNSHESPGSVTVPADFKKIAPPLIVQEPVQTPNTFQIKGDEKTSAENVSGPVLKELAIPYHKISSTSDNRITRDYIEYGQFEKNTDSAVIAVKNVKEKLKKQEKNEKSRELLDWIE